MRGKKALALAVGVMMALSMSPRGAGAITLGADDPAEIAVQAGGFDVVNGRDPAGFFSGEYRFAQTLFSLRPLLGGMVTTKGAVYGYAGFGLDISITPHWVLTPNAAVGAFDHGDGTDLGSTVEFRTGAELDYRFGDASRLGLTFNHISNAGIAKHNPGEEEIGISYAVPFGWILR